MAFTTLTTSQKTFLEQYLRGTNATLSAKQAAATFGIQKLTARVCEMRKAGLKIKRVKNTVGTSSYKMSRRTVDGSQAKIYA